MSSKKINTHTHYTSMHILQGNEKSDYIPPTTKSQKSSRFRAYFETYKRLTFAGVFAVMSVMTLTYAATQITSITQTAQKGDSITAAWVNEVNAALQKAIGSSGSTNISITGKERGCYTFRNVAEFNAIMQNASGGILKDIQYDYHKYQLERIHSTSNFKISHDGMGYGYIKNIQKINAINAFTGDLNSNPELRGIREPARNGYIQIYTDKWVDFLILTDSLMENMKMFQYVEWYPDQSFFQYNTVANQIPVYHAVGMLKKISPRTTGPGKLERYFSLWEYGPSTTRPEKIEGKDIIAKQAHICF